jgi:hypothetical protein
MMPRWPKDIVVVFDPPPIPDRQFDWRAYHQRDYDNYDGADFDADRAGPSFHCGFGKTEAKARADLRRMDREREESEIYENCRNNEDGRGTCKCKPGCCDVADLEESSHYR